MIKWLNPPSFPLPQDRFPRLWRQLKRKLKHLPLDRHAQDKLFALLPSANPLAFRAEKHPARCLSGAWAEFRHAQTVLPDKLLQLRRIPQIRPDERFFL